MTLEELKKKTGMAGARIVRKYKQGELIDGKAIIMDETEDGRDWRLEGDEVTYPEQPDVELTDEDEQVLEGIADDGETEGDTAQGDGKDEQEHEVTVDWLTATDGIGEKGAKKIVKWLKEHDIERTFEEVHFLRQSQSKGIRCLPGVGQKNGSELLGRLFDEFTHEREIRCPHCDGLFDRAPAGAYQSDWSQCLDDGGIELEVGDCGQRFWLEATDDGYETYEAKPSTLEEEAEVEGVEQPEEPQNEEPQVEEPQDEESAGTEQETCDTEEPEQEAPGEEGGAITWPDEAPSYDYPTGYVPEGQRAHPYLDACRPVAWHEDGTDAWHDQRRRGIGSSDVGAILGFSRFDPNHETDDESQLAANQLIWKDKIGEDVPDKPWMEPYQKFGTWFEPYLLEELEAQFGAQIIPGGELGTLQSAGWEHALANLDGLDVAAKPVVEECKTGSEPWTEIPLDLEAQTQHQMYVTGCDEARLRLFVCPIDREVIPDLRADYMEMADTPEAGERRLAERLLGHGEIHTWVVERDDRYIERMLDREQHFWAYVENEVIPPVVDPEGTVDLTDEPEVYAALCRYARKKRAYSEVAHLEEEQDDAKKAARKAIERAVGLDEDSPKRVRAGDHKATLVQTEHYKYWRLYEGGDDVPF